MAIQGTISAGSVIASGTGVLEFESSSTDKKYKVPFSALPSGGLQIPSTGWSVRTLGSSAAILVGSLSEEGANMIHEEGLFTTGTTYHAILGGIGKLIVSEDSNAGYDSQSEFITYDLPNIAKNGGEFVFHRSAHGIAVAPGSLAFERNRTFNSQDLLRFKQDGAYDFNDEILSGTGKALLTKENDEVTITSTVTAAEGTANRKVIFVGNYVESVSIVNQDNDGVPAAAISTSAGNIIITGTTVVADDVFTITLTPGGDAFEKVIDLDNIQYPFRIAVGEELQAIGSSVIVAEINS